MQIHSKILMPIIVDDSRNIEPDNANATVTAPKSVNNKEPLAIEPLEDLGNMPPMEPLGIPPVNLPLQDPYLQMNQDAVGCPNESSVGNPQNSESVINTNAPNNILSEIANEDRNDPYKTNKIIDNPVEPDIEKNVDGIGGDRDSIDVLKNESDLPQARIQKTLLDADITKKSNEFPLHEEVLDNYNNGSRQDNSEQSTQNEEPYKGAGKDTGDGEKSMQDMTDTLNQWKETDSKKGYYDPYKPTRKKEIQTPKLGRIAEHYKQNLARIDTLFMPPNRTTTREITQKSIPSNAFNQNNKSTTIRKGNTTVSF